MYMYGIVGALGIMKMEAFDLLTTSYVALRLLL